jgi:hypothetical protein
MLGSDVAYQLDWLRAKDHANILAAVVGRDHAGT